MASLALDSANNLALPFQVVRGIESVRVRVAERLRLVRGTFANDIDRGLPWKDWLGMGIAGWKGIRSALEVQAQVRAQVEDVSGVVGVAINVVRSGMRYAVTGTAQVEADGDAGTLELQTVIDPFATTGASPWYLITRAYSNPPAGVAGRVK